jgi:signal transduction histidine kinase
VRLTVLVTGAFAMVAIPGARLALQELESDLEEGLRLGAESVLTDYVDSIVGEAFTVGTVDDDEAVRFVYFDEAGEEISELDYFSVVFGSVDGAITSFGETVVDGEGSILDEGLILDDDLAEIGEVSTVPVFVDDIEFDPLAGAELSEITTLYVDDAAVAVGQAITLADGTVVTVGVSSPLSTIDQGMSAIRRVTWTLVPALVVLVAAVSWLATTRALAPIDRVTRRAQAISADDLSERLPVPATDDEVHALVVTVNDMLGRLENAQRQQRRLIADASHELRSPVAASRAQLEVALSIGASSPQAVDWEATAKTVLSEQEQLTELVEDLMALSRLDESGLATPHPVDVVAAVGREAERPRQPPPNLHLRPGLQAQIAGDEAMLRRAIRNLLDNAGRFAVERIDVTVERTTGSVRIVVDDDGPGVPTDDRERIFERFTRLDQSRTRSGGGSGLGLAIVRTVAEAHGGFATCDQSPWGGARFTIELPAMA